MKIPVLALTYLIIILFQLICFVVQLIDNDWTKITCLTFFVELLGVESKYKQKKTSQWNWLRRGKRPLGNLRYVKKKYAPFVYPLIVGWDVFCGWLKILELVWDKLFILHKFISFIFRQLFCNICVLQVVLNF